MFFAWSNTVRCGVGELQPYRGTVCGDDASAEFLRGNVEMCGFQSTPGQSVTVQDGLPVFRSIFCVAQGTSVREHDDGGGVVVQARLACIK
jgi:hypothetical protein